MRSTPGENDSGLNAAGVKQRQYGCFLFDILLKEKLSSCNGDGPVCRVDQVIDTLTVLRGQHFLCTTVEITTQIMVNYTIIFFDCLSKTSN